MMCGFPQGVTNILDPAQTGQPWTPERVMQFGGMSPAFQAAYHVNPDGTPIGGPGAMKIKEGPAAIPTNTNVSAAGGPSTFGQPRQAGDPTAPLPRTLLGA